MVKEKSKSSMHEMIESWREYKRIVYMRAGEDFDETQITDWAGGLLDAEAVVDNACYNLEQVGKTDMLVSEYNDLVHRTAIYHRRFSNHVYPSIGLAGETGEYMEKVKRIEREYDGDLSKATKEEKVAMLKELGDVLWYIVASAHELGSDLHEVMKLNIEKIYSRRERGTLHGDGDNR